MIKIVTRTTSSPNSKILMIISIAGWGYMASLAEELIYPTSDKSSVIIADDKSAPSCIPMELPVLTEENRNNNRHQMVQINNIESAGDGCMGETVKKVRQNREQKHRRILVPPGVNTTCIV